MPYVVSMRHTWLPENRYSKGQPKKGGVELANDLERIVQTFGANTIAACFVEPIAGSTGCLVPPTGYLERLRELCDKHGILLVFDEVITGFGRLGVPFASQAFGVTPDIMTMAKALTNGAQPMGAVAVKDEIYDTIVDAAPEGAVEFFHGYTYSAHPAACAAGIATLKIYEDEKLFDQAAGLSGYFLDKLFDLSDIDIVTDIRGYGLLGGIDIKPDAVPGARGSEVQKKLFWNGLHLKFTGDSGIIAPPLVAKEEQIDELVDVLRHTLGPVDSYRAAPALVDFFASKARVCRNGRCHFKRAQHSWRENPPRLPLPRPGEICRNRPASSSLVLEYARHVLRPPSSKPTRFRQTGARVLTVHRP